MAEIRSKWPWPRDAALLGTHPEEVKALRQRIEKNPAASPMPDLAPARLLSPSRTSDSLRMGGPVTADVDDVEHEIGARLLQHVVFRRILTKARRRAAVAFDEAVDSEPIDGDAPSGRREQMKAMIARERAMLEIFDRYNALAEDVYMRLLATSKG